MRLGAQVSAARSKHLVYKRAADITADTLMFYTKSNRRWDAKPLTDKDVAKFKDAAEEYDEIYPAVVHANYLMNLANPEEEKWHKSYESLVDEITRTAQLGVELMVMHPGSHLEEGEEPGLDRIATGLRQALDETADTAPNVIVCLETMSGQGTNLGYKFEHLAYLIDALDGHERLGVCFDTCHVFTAGYDIRTPKTYEETMRKFDETIGFDRLKCFHFNDSKYDLDTRRDRHEHIGEGYIGAEGFANFVNDERWADHPAHLETPKTKTTDDDEKIEMDPVNLQTLRDLIE